jgi:hypothetical protein
VSHQDKKQRIEEQENGPIGMLQALSSNAGVTKATSHSTSGFYGHVTHHKTFWSRCYVCDAEFSQEVGVDTIPENADVDLALVAPIGSKPGFNRQKLGLQHLVSQFLIFEVEAVVPFFFPHFCYSHAFNHSIGDIKEIVKGAKETLKILPQPIFEELWDCIVDKKLEKAINDLP